MQTMYSQLDEMIDESSLGPIGKSQICVLQSATEKSNVSHIWAKKMDSGHF